MIDINKNDAKRTEKLPETYIYRRISTLWIWIRVIVAIYILAEISNIVLNIILIIPKFQGISNALGGNELDWGKAVESMEVNIGNMLIGSSICAVALLISIILIAVWINRSHKNARALGVEGLTKSPAWAVGSFFVPFINLVVPYRAMKELVSGSLKKVGKQLASGVMLVWWLSYLLMSGAERASTFLFDRAVESMEKLDNIDQLNSSVLDLISSVWLDSLASALGVISAIALFYIMKSVQSVHAHIANTLENKNNE